MVFVGFAVFLGLWSGGFISSIDGKSEEWWNCSGLVSEFCCGFVLVSLLLWSLGFKFSRSRFSGVKVEAVVSGENLQWPWKAEITAWRKLQSCSFYLSFVLTRYWVVANSVRVSKAFLRSFFSITAWSFFLLVLFFHVAMCPWDVLVLNGCQAAPKCFLGASP